MSLDSRPTRWAVGLVAGVTLLQLSLVTLVFWVPSALPPDLAMEYMSATRDLLLALTSTAAYLLAPLAAATACGKLVLDGYKPPGVLGLFGLSAIGCGLGFAAVNASVATLARPLVMAGRSVVELGGAVLLASIVGVAVGARFSESGD